MATYKTDAHPPPDLAGGLTPEQVAAWRDGSRYVAELAEDSAGR